VLSFARRNETLGLVAGPCLAHPSQADELITGRLRDALALVDVRVLDHLVVTGDAIVSFAERGLL
jgi:DNA repair protein RadC